MSNITSPTDFTTTHQTREPLTKKQVIIAMLIIIIGIVLTVCLSVFVAPKLRTALYRSAHPIEFKITDASITQFNLTSSDTICYNFKVTVTARNFDNDMQTFLGTIKVIPSYKGNQLPWVTIEPVVLGSKNTIELQPIVFEGNSTIKLKPRQLIEYIKETQLGIYNLGLDLSEYSPYPYEEQNIHCRSLRIPLISDGKPAPTFDTTTCRYKEY